MRIQVASDLHLEFPQNHQYMMDQWKCDGDILVLCGDVCNLYNFKPFKTFLGKYSRKYDLILYIPGNHEYYNSDFDLIKKHQSLQEKYSNCTFINNQAIKIGKVKFICSTLWSNANREAAKRLNDYFVIRNISRLELNKIHKDNVETLNELLSQKQKGYVVVLTHHLPLLNCIDKKYKDDPINSCFVSNQEEIFKKHRIHYWFHGHSHQFNEIDVVNVPFKNKISQTKILRNPIGYRHAGELTYINPFTIDLE